MSSDEESDTVEASISLLTEPVYVPETQHNEFQFVAEDDETSHDERQSPRKSKRGSQAKKRKYSQNIYEKMILLNLIVSHVIRRFLQQKELIKELFKS